MINLRPFDYRLVKPEWIEQIKDRRYSDDRIRLAMQAYPSDFFLVYEGEELRGFSWHTYNPIEESVFINTLSLDKKARHNSQLFKRIIDQYKAFAQASKISRIEWSTTRPAFFEKMGFVKSKFIVLEYQIDGGSDGRQ